MFKRKRKTGNDGIDKEGLILRLCMFIVFSVYGLMVFYLFFGGPNDPNMNILKYWLCLSIPSLAFLKW